MRQFHIGGNVFHNTNVQELEPKLYLQSYLLHNYKNKLSVVNVFNASPVDSDVKLECDNQRNGCSKQPVRKHM